MNLKLFIFNFLYIFPSVTFSADAVYTWISKNGVKHYSDKPFNLTPEKSKYIIINNSNLFLNKNDKTNKTNNNSINIDNYNDKNIEQQNNINITNFKAQNCTIAKKNLQIAQKTINLSEEDKKTVIENYQNDIDKYCN